jgi:defect in organelle trafficking protein DotC|tara:strand:+ start:2466 stop:3209 length:744 start_codon:yes stop_codon:yes gene_type:complete
MNKPYYFILPLLLLLGACSNNGDEEIPLNPIRTTAITEAAVSYGAQYALAWRIEIIRQEIKQHEHLLNSIFDFRSFVMQNNVLPPVLQQSSSNLHLSNPNAMRVNDLEIEIIMPARLITTAPLWSDYISFNDYTYPDTPDYSLLPKNSDERYIWDKEVQKGWKQGVIQADSIFSDNLASLTRDINGMTLYKKLYTQNMISAPYIAKAELGVTGNTAKMRLNDKVIRIMQPSVLNTEQPDSWNTVIVQ